MGPKTNVGRRTIPGSRRTVSALGISVEGRNATSPAGPGTYIAGLRRLRAEGLSLFDTAGAPSRTGAESRVASAFPEPDTELLVIVGVGAPETPRPPSRRAPSATGGDLPGLGEVTASLTESRRRLAPKTPVLVELPAPPDGRAVPKELLDELESLRTDGSVVDWCWTLPSVPETASTFVATNRPRLVAADLSLLRPRMARALDAAARSHGVRAIARDPFDGGLLDGTRFAHAVTSREPRSGPPDLRSLAREFDPVLRLDFLTRGRRRTLAQAALQYLLSRPWIASVLVPLPNPERWQELLDATTTDPLTPDEVARLEAASDDSAGEK